LAFHLGREAGHSPPSSAEAKEWVELYLHSPNTPSWRGAQLGETQGQLYLYLKRYASTQDSSSVTPTSYHSINEDFVNSTERLMFIFWNKNNSSM
jgi:hypothetical protein